MTPLLEVQGLTVTVSAESGPLLRGIDMQLLPGERVALMGGSGVGKTVLLRSLALLEPWDCGRFLWMGQPLADSEVPRFRAQVIYLHQKPALDEGSVEDCLRAVFQYRGHRGRSFERSRIERYLARAGFDASFLRKPARLLSGGESQVVALLRAIQLDPQALLLDEPTAALDADKTRMVEELVALWFADAPLSRAIIWITHDERQARRIAPKRLVLDREGIKQVKQSEQV